MIDLYGVILGLGLLWLFGKIWDVIKLHRLTGQLQQEIREREKQCDAKH